MTITLGFWILPAAIVAGAYIAACVLDKDFRTGGGGFLDGLGGCLIVVIGIVLALGLAIGRLLS